MRPKVLTPKQGDRIAKRYLEGASMRRLAAEYGCSTAPIVRVLDERGIPRRASNNPEGRPATRDEEMRS